MLGRPYIVEGPVVKGKGMGRRIQFPTLNVEWNPEVRPRYGVYRVVLKTDDDDTVVPGIANYGLRPTVDASTNPLLEVHLLSSNSIPGCGDVVRVGLLDFIREERSFPSIDELKKQIEEDVQFVSGSFPGENLDPDGF
jgi:riboflavin kinase/FMN adenylyltransferase